MALAPHKSGARHAVLAGFLGWTLDAFDFFVIVFLFDTLAHQFGVTKKDMVFTTTATLALLAERLELGDHLLLGRGEEKTGGRRKQALLADGYEALIAAIYLDGGIEEARQFIRREFSALLDEAREHGVVARDFKSGLQELVQARNRPLPEYRLIGTLGPDHQKRFEVEVAVGGEPLARGSGRSKKDAEQEAARLALINLNNAG